MGLPVLSAHEALMFVSPQLHTLDPPLVELRALRHRFLSMSNPPPHPRSILFLVVANIDNFVFSRDFLSSGLSHLEFVRTCAQMALY